MIEKLIIALIILTMLILPATASEFIDASDYPDYDWASVIKYYDESDILIDGMTIVNAPYFSILIRNCNNVTISNNVLYNQQSSGIKVIDSTNIIIKNNVIVDYCMNEDQEGISLQNVDGFVVAGNTLINGYKEGIDAKSGCKNGVIRDNFIFNCVDARPHIYIDAYARNNENIRVMRNVCLGTGQGISLATEKGGTLYKIYIGWNVVMVDSNAFSIHKYTTDGSHFKDRIYVYYNLFKSNDARSVHITDNPENFGKFLMYRNTLIGSTIGV